MTTTDVRNDLYRARRQMSGDALIASDCKSIITEAFEKCAAILKDASSNRAHDILSHLEEAEGIAGLMQIENE